MSSTGQCTYPNLVRGTQCSDNIFYTYNDSCDGYGTCVGKVDMCLKYNVQCDDGVPDCTTIPGQCLRDTGRCVYDFKPQDTPCEDGRAYTVGDQCSNGLCVGQIVNLCSSADCTPQPWDTCHGVGTCVPSTGFCNYPALPNGQPCEDNLPDRAARKPYCIDGVCVGDPYKGDPKYLTVGDGQCVDALGKRMSAQQGDVGEEQECREFCNKDNQCRGYSYAFPVCTLFGTVRNKADKLGWTLLKGDQPPALDIERVLAAGVGEPVFVCRKKHPVGDPTQMPLEVIGFIVGWFGFSVLFILLISWYFRVSLRELATRGQTAVLARYKEANSHVQLKYLEARTMAGGSRKEGAKQNIPQNDLAESSFDDPAVIEGQRPPVEENDERSESEEEEEEDEESEK